MYGRASCGTIQLQHAVMLNIHEYWGVVAAPNNSPAQQPRNTTVISKIIFKMENKIETVVYRSWILLAASM